MQLSAEGPNSTAGVENHQLILGARHGDTGRVTSITGSLRARRGIDPRVPQKVMV